MRKCECTHNLANRLMKLRDQIASILRISRRPLHSFMWLVSEWPVDWDRWQEICGNKKPQPPGAPQGGTNADQKANWG